MNEVELVLGRLCPIVGFIGLILNSIVVLVFSSATYKEQSLYIYLKLEAIFICLDMLITCFKPMFYCSTCPISNQLPAQIYQVYFNIFGASVLEMAALMFRNFSALICFLLISSTQHFAARSFVTRFILDKKSMRFMVPIIIIYSCGVYSYQLFEYRIVTLVSYENYTYAEIWRTEFGESRLKKNLEITATILRDCINLFILVVLNCLILAKLRMNLRRKKNLIKLGLNESMSRSQGCSQANERPASSSGDAIKSIKRKESRQTVMVVLTCLNYLLGRIPLLYLFIKINVSIETSNFGIYAILIAYISYAANFSFYYASNGRFRESINCYLKKIF